MRHRGCALLVFSALASATRGRSGQGETVLTNCIDAKSGLPKRACEPASALPKIDPERRYQLAELVDIAEQSSPRTRIAWEEAKARANAIGIEKSALFPTLAFLATAGQERIVNPFPKPLAPKGFTVVDLPSAIPSLKLNYVLLDFGLRKARIDAARMQALASTHAFVRENQGVAYHVAESFFRVMAAEEAFVAARQNFTTARTTQEAAREQLNRGRATLPDVLHAEAETARADYQLQAAEGEVSLSKVSLTEVIGAEPSPQIQVDAGGEIQPPDTIADAVEFLIHQATTQRPDLKAEIDRLHQAEAKVREAKSAYRPSVSVDASGSQTTVWPTANVGQFGSASVPTWSLGIHVRWEILDGGRRNAVMGENRALVRQQAERVRERKDAAVRDVWEAYVQFLTAVKRQRAARKLLTASQSSYDSSLEAFQLGVQNFVDVVTAERGLADSRSAQVAARSLLFTAAAKLEFAVGTILSGKRVTQPAVAVLQ